MPAGKGILKTISLDLKVAWEHHSRRLQNSGRAVRPRASRTCIAQGQNLWACPKARQKNAPRDRASSGARKERSLQQWNGVADDQAVFVLVAGSNGGTGAPHGVFPGEADVLEGAFRNHVRQADITFPLALAASGVLDIVAVQVDHAGGQARYADLGEVIGVASLPGTFAGTAELLDLHVGDGAVRRAVTLVQPWEVAVAFGVLITSTEGVTGNRVQGQVAVQVVVDLALGDRTAVVTRGEVVFVAAVGAVVAAAEVAQVAFQDARTDGPVVH